MSNEESQLSAAKLVAIELLEAAKGSEDLKNAGKTMGRSLSTIATTIENALLPLAALNFGIQKAKDYFSGDFQRDFAEKISEIPIDNIVDPKPSLAGPALQGLSFCLDEAELKDMYLNLLKTAVDSRVSGNAHPSFVEIIKQMDAEEARKFKIIAHASGLNPMVRFKKTIATGGFIMLDKYVIDFIEKESGVKVVVDKFEQMFENWQRLGLVESDFTRTSFAEGAYDWVELNPLFINLKNKCEEGGEIEFDKGIYGLTKFGKTFVNSVGIV